MWHSLVMLVTSCTVASQPSDYAAAFWSWAESCRAANGMYWAAVSEHLTHRVESDQFGRVIQERDQRSWQGLIGAARYPDAVRCRTLSVRDADAQSLDSSAEEWIRRNAPKFLSGEAKDGDAVVRSGKGMTRIALGQAFAEQFPILTPFDRPPPAEFPAPLFGLWCLDHVELVHVESTAIDQFIVTIDGRPTQHYFSVKQGRAEMTRCDIVANGRVVQRVVYDKWQVIPEVDILTQSKYRVFIEETGFTAPRSAARDEDLVCMGNWVVTEAFALGKTPDSLFDVNFDARTNVARLPVQNVPMDGSLDASSEVPASAVLQGFRSDPSATRWFSIAGAGAVLFLALGWWRWRTRMR